MAVLSISSLLFFFSDNQKSIKRGENHYKSNHIEAFVYDQNYITGKVHVSMKKKIYNVMEIKFKLLVSSPIHNYRHQLITQYLEGIKS